VACGRSAPGPYPPARCTSCHLPWWLPASTALRSRRRPVSGRTSVRSDIAADTRMATDTRLVPAGHQLSGARSFRTADGQSADRSGSLQLPLLFVKADPAGGLRPPSGPAATQRSPGCRPLSGLAHRPESAQISSKESASRGNNQHAATRPSRISYRPTVDQRRSILPIITVPSVSAAMRAPSPTSTSPECMRKVRPARSRRRRK
jgi:hypothetical protein